MKRIEGFEEARQLLSREAPPLIEEGAVAVSVRQIVDEVMVRGDDALRQYSREFDKAVLAELEIPSEQIKAAPEEIDESLFKALKLASAWKPTARRGNSPGLCVFGDVKSYPATN